jgi:hypothetical protein
VFELIEKLRGKPENVKKRIAFLSAFSLAGSIFVVWLSVIYPDFKDTEAKKENVAAVVESPTDSFSEALLGGFSHMMEQFQDLRKSVSNFSTEVEYYSATGTRATITTIPTNDKAEQATSTDLISTTTENQ